jgi:hypothetical protein
MNVTAAIRFSNYANNNVYNFPPYQRNVPMAPVAPPGCFIWHCCINVYGAFSSGRFTVKAGKTLSPAPSTIIVDEWITVDVPKIVTFFSDGTDYLMFDYPADWSPFWNGQTFITGLGMTAHRCIGFQNHHVTNKFSPNE